jgi:PAS domain S-box-containing protein
MPESGILIVEDENIIALDLESRLLGLGYRVVGIAASGLEAIRKAEALQPDLVTMDIVLKGDTDGIQAADQIRARLDLPVIFVTAYFDNKTLERAKQAAPYGYVLKPFEDRELRSTIEVALYRHSMEKKLRDSEARFRLLAEHARDLIFRYRRMPTPGFEYVSPSAATLLGYAPEEFYADPELGYKIVHPDDRQCLKPPTEPDPFKNSLVLRWLRRDGQMIWLEQTIVPLYDEAGHLIAVEGVMRDVTERKQAEEALRESERKFRRIIEQSSDAIVLTDEQGGIIEWNWRAEQLIGLKRAEALGRSVWDIQFQMSPEERRAPATYEHIKAAELDLLRTGQSPWLHQIQEVEIQRLDGTRRMVQTTTFSTQTAQGFMLGSIMRDITGRKQAEEVLARHDREMAALYETSLEVNSLLDVSALLHAIVRRSAELLGMQMGGLYLVTPGGDALELVVSHNLPRDFTDVKLQLGEGLAGRVAQAGQPMMVDDYSSWEGRVAVYADGSFHRVLGVPLKARNRVLGVITVQDEQVGLFSEDEIRLISLFADQAAIAVENAWLVATLRQSNAELATRNEELDAFARTVAHDLRNPLGSLMGFADTLAAYYETMLDDERNMCLKAVHRNGQRMGSIIDELLLLASVRQEDVQLEPLDMHSLVSEARYRVEQVLKDHTVQFVIPAEWPVAIGYAPWVEQVWVNYLSNAIKYGAPPAETHQTPLIELGADILPGGAVRFWVRDNGRGLTADECARLFTPFTRLKQVHAKGYGLGLSIVRRIVEKLGGQVAVESSGVPGQGSTFSFTLPAKID